jgi:hypothetical protein
MLWSFLAKLARAPNPSDCGGNPSTLALLKQAFEAAGVRFTDTCGVEPPKS